MVGKLNEKSIVTRVLIWHYLEKNSERNVYLAYNLTGRLLYEEEQGCSGAWDAGRRRPHTFFDEGGVPHSPTFWTEIRAKVSPLLQLVTY